MHIIFSAIPVVGDYNTGSWRVETVLYPGCWLYFAINRTDVSKGDKFINLGLIFVVLE
ncbi:MAG: hypothetical protein AB7F40_04420 [Victivallaceae bacterium]